MKDLLRFGLVMAVVTSALVGCSGGEQTASGNSSAPTSTPPPGKGGVQTMGATPGPGSGGGDSRVGSQAGGGN